MGDILVGFTCFQYYIRSLFDDLFGVMNQLLLLVLYGSCFNL